MGILQNELGRTCSAIFLGRLTPSLIWHKLQISSREKSKPEIASFFESTPLKIPTIEGVPTAATDVTFTLQGAAINGVASGSDTAGFLDFDSSIIVDVTASGTEVVSRSFDDSIYKDAA